MKKVELCANNLRAAAIKLSRMGDDCTLSVAEEIIIEEIAHNILDVAFFLDGMVAQVEYHQATNDEGETVDHFISRGFPVTLDARLDLEEWHFAKGKQSDDGE